MQPHEIPKHRLRANQREQQRQQQGQQHVGGRVFERGGAHLDRQAAQAAATQGDVGFNQSGRQPAVPALPKLGQHEVVVLVHPHKTNGLVRLGGGEQIGHLGKITLQQWRLQRQRQRAGQGLGLLLLQALRVQHEHGGSGHGHEQGGRPHHQRNQQRKLGLQAGGKARALRLKPIRHRRGQRLVQGVAESGERSATDCCSGGSCTALRQQAVQLDHQRIDLGQFRPHGQQALVSQLLHKGASNRLLVGKLQQRRSQRGG